MKKVVSALLSAAMVATMATGFAVSTAAQTEYTLPFVSPAELPTIDGDISDSVWQKGFQMSLDQNSEGFSTSDFETSIDPASVNISAFWSATLVDPEVDPYWDPDLDYDYTQDPQGGLYFKFDVTDKTLGWANGDNGIGHIDANAMDAMQVFICPSVMGSIPPVYDTKDIFIYSFTGYSAGGPGVGSIPSGQGAWYEHFSINGNVESHPMYGITLATKMKVTFDPAYPHPGAASDDMSSSEYKAWKQKLDAAYEHLTDYQGYTQEVFLPWAAINLNNSIPTLNESGKIYMVFYLLDYYFDWANYAKNGIVNENQKINFTKASVADIKGRGNPFRRPRDNYDQFNLGKPYFGPVEPEYVKGDATGDGNVRLNDVTAIAMHVAGIKALEGTNLLAADATGDGNVRLNDVTAVAMHVAGIQALS